jgi:hypothetical protein
MNAEPGIASPKGTPLAKYDRLWSGKTHHIKHRPGFCTRPSALRT